MIWKIYARRSHAPLSARLLQEGQQEPFFEESTGIKYGIHNHLWLEDVIHLRIEELDGLMRELQTVILRDDWSFLTVFAKRCKETLAQLTATAVRLSEHPKLTSGSNAEIACLIDEWFAIYKKACSFIPVFRTIDKILVNYLPQESQSNFISGAHSHITEETRERTELRNIVTRLNSFGDLKATSALATELIEHHVEEFGWLGMRWYLGSPLTNADVHSRVVALLSRPQSYNTPQNWLPDNKDGDWRKPIIDELAFLRSHRAEAINKAIWTIRPLFSSLCVRLSLDYSEIVYMLPGEVISSLEGQEPPVNIIQLRKQCFGTVLLDDVYYDFAGRQAVEAFQRSIKLQIPSNTLSSDKSSRSELTLRGVAASPGKVTGRVKLVSIESDCEKVLDGDILVTIMTYPSMVASMQRAAAIVTDDGGLLSHAAVTARELEKPCLIDTKNATELLSDGDLVEVDCVACVVRKLASQ